MIRQPEEYTIVDVLNNAVSDLPDQSIYHYLDDQLNVSHQLTYSSIKNKALMIAAHLESQGIKKGDRVLLIYQPGLEFVTAFFGCLYGGFIAVPCYPPANKSTVEKLVHIIDNAKPRIILSDQGIVNKMKSLNLVKMVNKSKLLNIFLNKLTKRFDDLMAWNFDEFRWVVTDKLKYDNPQQQRTLPKLTDIAFLQYTSGSTFIPKGVIINHENLMANLRMITAGVKVDQQDKIVSWLPVYHDMGLIGGLLIPLFNRAKVYLYSPLHFLKQPASWLQSISKHTATISVAPNFAYAMCLKKVPDAMLATLNLNHTRALLNGAEPINDVIINSFLDRFASCGLNRDVIYPCYGLAESTLFVTGKFGLTSVQHDQIKDGEKNIVSCGVPNGNVYIVNPDTGAVCPPGEIGEICISGACVTAGYWENESETNKLKTNIMVDDCEMSVLKTGDLGFVKNNELYVTGRIKDLIIINGENYYPQDIEQAVECSSTKLRSGCVAAFNITASNGKETLAILAEVNDNIKENEANDLLVCIKEMIYTDFTLPVETIVLIKSRTIHKTTSGKIKRYANKMALLRDELVVIARYDMLRIASVGKNNVEEISPLNQALRGYIKQELAKICNLDSPDKIDENMHFSDLGLDSLTLIELQNKIEDYLSDKKVKFDSNDIIEHPTIARLANFVDKKYS